MIDQNKFLNWLELKKEEQDAAELRKKLEAEILEELGVKDNNVEKSLLIYNDNEFKLYVKGNIAYSVDEEALAEKMADPEFEKIAALAFRTKHELNVKAFTRMDAKCAEEIRPVISAKYIRPTFTLTKKEKENE